MELEFSIFSWIFFVLLLISLGVGLFFLKGRQQNAQIDTRATIWNQALWSEYLLFKRCA